MMKKSRDFNKSETTQKVNALEFYVYSNIIRVYYLQQFITKTLN